MKTFIKWQGNKTKHINKFIEYIPKEYNTYIEPFIGSGALFLKLTPGKWIINDLNKDLINSWNSIKDIVEEIILLFIHFGNNFKELSKENKILYCKDITSKIENLPYNVNRASNFILMKHCAYMGHIFVNNKFCFYSLDGPIFYDKSIYFLSDNYYNNLRNVSEYLNNENGHIYNKDYKQILRKSKKNDFVFLDPPYIETNNYKFNYNKNEILDESFIHTLLLEVKKLDRKNVKWMMTQADTVEIKDIFKDYNIKEFPVYRSISKSYKNELLIMNYDQ